MSYDIASISETTTPIDKKFQDNIWTTKVCPTMQYCDVITNPRWRTEAERHFDNGYMTKTANLQNTRWRTAAILKIVKSPYLREKSSDFDEISYTAIDIEPDDSHVTKNENRFCGHNSSTDFPTSAKFCVKKQNGMTTKATWQKLQIFKIQDGGRPPYWKSLNHHISVKILFDFDKI